MMKSSLLITIMNYYPMFIHMLFILIMSIPSKNNKFNPITLIILLIFMTMLISLKINLIINSWSSFILFLIVIGGLMIIFMYITSLINNELFMLNYKIILINLMKIMPMIMILWIFDLNYLDFNNSNTWINLFNDMKLNFSELYNKPYNNNSIFIMNYLFYSMICIMNICYKFKMPLRQLMF